jgi:hypothetical protein
MDEGVCHIICPGAECQSELLPAEILDVASKVAFARYPPHTPSWVVEKLRWTGLTNFYANKCTNLILISGAVPTRSAIRAKSLLTAVNTPH